MSTLTLTLDLAHPAAPALLRAIAGALTPAEARAVPEPAPPTLPDEQKAA